MKATRVILFIAVLFCIKAIGQSRLTDFRAFEKRVCYLYPDSLLLVSEQMDSITKADRTYKYFYLGKYYFWKSQYDLAFIHLSKAESICRGTVDYLLLAEVSLDISKCLAILENTGNALEHLLLSKEIFDKTGTTEQKARVHVALGELYRKIGDYETANQVLDRGKQFCFINDDLLAAFYNRKAAIKTELGQLDSSLCFSSLALTHAKKSKDVSLIAISENEIGYVFRQKNEFDSALVHLHAADSIFRSCGMTAYALQVSCTYGVVLSLKNEFKKAISVCFEGFEIADKNDWHRIERDLAEQLRNTYYHLGKNDSGLYYHAKMYEAQTHLLINQHHMNTHLVESLYAKEKFQQQISDQQRQLQLARERNESAVKAKNYVLLLFGLVVVILLLTLYTVFLQIKRRRIIQADKAEKEKQNTELRRLLKNNEALVQEISHRVKNNLSVLSGLLGIQQARSDNAEVKKELKDAILRIDSISSIHNQLYDTKESARINLKKAIVELTENICNATGFRFGETIEPDLDEIFLEISQAVSVSMIINELITNSFKHAAVSTDRKVLVCAKVIAGEISVCVSDCGPGFSEKKSQETKNSMGLYLVDILCRQLHAQKEVSHDGKRFYFSIRFKL